MPLIVGAGVNCVTIGLRALRCCCRCARGYKSAGPRRRYMVLIDVGLPDFEIRIDVWWRYPYNRQIAAGSLWRMLSTNLENESWNRVYLITVM